ncbi:hypothetical protein D3C80_1089580 [compost metagenome]
MRQKNRQRRFRNAGNSKNNDICLENRSNVFSVVVINRKFYGIHTAKIIVVKPLMPPGSTFWSVVKSIHKCLHHWSHNVDNAHIQPHGLLPNHVPKLGLNQGIYNKSPLFSHFFHHTSNLVFTPDVHIPFNFAIRQFKLLKCSTDNCFRGFSDRVRTNCY